LANIIPFRQMTTITNRTSIHANLGCIPITHIRSDIKVCVNRLADRAGLGSSIHQFTEEHTNEDTKPKAKSAS
jgi:hypothetical protein